MSEAKLSFLGAFLSFLGAGGGVVAFATFLFPDPLMEQQVFEQEHFDAPLYVPIVVEEDGTVQLFATASRRTELTRADVDNHKITGAQIEIEWRSGDLAESACNARQQQVRADNGPHHQLAAKSEERSPTGGNKYIDASISCTAQVRKGHNLLIVRGEALGVCGSSDKTVCDTMHLRAGYTLFKD